MLCGMCNEQESVGTIFKMCRQCYDAFSKRIDVAEAQGKKYDMTDQEAMCVNPAFRYQKGGGDVPDNVAGVTVVEKEDGIEVHYHKTDPRES